MSQPFLGEIKIVSFNFAPAGWAFCNGQFLPINQNQGLFSLLGTTYGGDGRTTFALPNLRGQVPIHMGAGHTMGEQAGTSAVTVNLQQLPTHIHQEQAQPTTNNSQLPAVGAVLCQASNVYHTADNLTAINPASVTSIGGSQPHNNMMPYLVLNFIIALQGIFPAQN
jgi:microcystin-dependent protein